MSDTRFVGPHTLTLAMGPLGMNAKQQLTRNRYWDLRKACLPLIEAYNRDLLVHDRRTLRLYEGAYLHYTNYCGTHLVLLRDTKSLPKNGERIPWLFGTANRQHIASQMVTMAEYMVSRSMHTLLACHYFDGKTLRKITGEQGIAIAKDHVRKLHNEWDARKLMAYA